MDKRNKQKPVASLEQISVFLETQQQELSIKAEQLSLRKVEIELNAQLAEKNTQAEKEVHKMQQEHSLRVHTNRMVIILSTLVLLVGFAVFALFLNKDTILIKLIEFAVVAAGSGFGGYAIGKAKTKEE